MRWCINLMSMQKNGVDKCEKYLRELYQLEREIKTYKNEISYINDEGNTETIKLRQFILENKSQIGNLNIKIQDFADIEFESFVEMNQNTQGDLREMFYECDDEYQCTLIEDKLERLQENLNDYYENHDKRIKILKEKIEEEEMNITRHTTTPSMSPRSLHTSTRHTTTPSMSPRSLHTSIQNPYIVNFKY